MEVGDTQFASWVAAIAALGVLGLAPAFTRGRRGVALYACVAGVIAAIAVLLPWYSEVWGDSDTNYVPGIWGPSAFHTDARVTLDGTSLPFLGRVSAGLALAGAALAGRLALHDRRDVTPWSSLAPAMFLATAAVLAGIDVFHHSPRVHSSNAPATYDMVWARDYGLVLHATAAACGAFWAWQAHRRLGARRLLRDRVARRRERRVAANLP